MIESRKEVCMRKRRCGGRGVRRLREGISRIKREAGRKTRALHYKRTACTKALRCKVLELRGLPMVRYDEY